MNRFLIPLLSGALVAQVPTPVSGDPAPITIRNPAGKSAPSTAATADQAELDAARALIDEMESLHADVSNTGAVAGKVKDVLLQLQQQMAADADVVSGAAAQQAALQLLVADLSDLRDRADRILQQVENRVKPKLLGIRAKVATHVDFATSDTDRSQWLGLLADLDSIITELTSQSAWLTANREKLDRGVRELRGQFDFVGTVRLIAIYGPRVIKALASFNEKLQDILSILPGVQAAGLGPTSVIGQGGTK